MTFGQSYLTHLKCLENVGMTRIDPVRFQRVDIIPIQFLRPAARSGVAWPATKGKTNIGCIFEGREGRQAGAVLRLHTSATPGVLPRVGRRRISYTNRRAAMIGAKMFLEGKWTTKGVHTCEEFDPIRSWRELNKQGLPWKESFDPVMFLEKSAMLKTPFLLD